MSCLEIGDGIYHDQEKRESPTVITYSKKLFLWTLWMRVLFKALSTRYLHTSFYLHHLHGHTDFYFFPACYFNSEFYYFIIIIIIIIEQNKIKYYIINICSCY